MGAREILEKMCMGGDDAWQSSMLGLRAQLNRILESWSAERKKEIVDRESKRGKELIDHAVLGDYDVVLWKIPCHADFVPEKFFYTVSINSGQSDPNDPDTQRVRFPGTMIGHMPGKSMLETLAGWVDSYGHIAVGTVALDKLRKYRVMLSKYFSVEPFDKDYPDQSGFWIS